MISIIIKGLSTEKSEVLLDDVASIDRICMDCYSELLKIKQSTISVIP